VNGQLERIETWVKRAAEQEVNTLIAKITFILNMTLFASLYRHLTGYDNVFCFTAASYNVSLPVTCLLSNITLVLIECCSEIFCNIFSMLNFMLDRLGILYPLNNGMGVL
jgi:hypothetical protein